MTNALLCLILSVLSEMRARKAIEDDKLTLALVSMVAGAFWFFVSGYFFLSEIA